MSDCFFVTFFVARGIELLDRQAQRCNLLFQVDTGKKVEGDPIDFFLPEHNRELYSERAQIAGEGRQNAHHVLKKVNSGTN